MLRRALFGMVIALASASTAAADATSAEKALRSEPKVKELLYQPGKAVEWQVGVITDGTQRHGYAVYVCDLLRSHGASTTKTIVRIVDIAKIAAKTDTFRSASLGSVRCSTYEQLMP